MIYAILMTAGILEFLFAVLLVMEFFDMEAEKESEYVEGYEDGLQNGLYIAQKMCDDPSRYDASYYDALCDEANCWFGIEGD